jgi:hypothetical protein
MDTQGVEQAMRAGTHILIVCAHKFFSILTKPGIYGKLQRHSQKLE